LICLGINEVRGADCRLPQREPAVIRWDLRMGENYEVILFEAPDNLFE
jgi:hypothetical protein